MSSACTRGTCEGNDILDTAFVENEVPAFDGQNSRGTERTFATRRAIDGFSEEMWDGEDETEKEPKLQPNEETIRNCMNNRANHAYQADNRDHSGVKRWSENGQHDLQASRREVEVQRVVQAETSSMEKSRI